jgi:hypothetical protein
MVGGRLAAHGRMKNDDVPSLSVSRAAEELEFNYPTG